MLSDLVQECQERTKAQNCYEIRDRGTCLVTNDPRTDYAGPCGWCGDKCGNDNVCEPVVWLNSNNNKDFEDCLKEGETTTTSTTTAKGWSKIIMYNIAKIYVRSIVFNTDMLQSLLFFHFKKDATQMEDLILMCLVYSHSFTKAPRITSVLM